MPRMLVYLNKNSNTVIIMLYHVVQNNRNMNNSLCNRENYCCLRQATNACLQSLDNIAITIFLERVCYKHGPLIGQH